MVQANVPSMRGVSHCIIIIWKRVCGLEADPWAETQGRMHLARSSYSRRLEVVGDLIVLTFPVISDT